MTSVWTIESVAEVVRGDVVGDSSRSVGGFKSDTGEVQAGDLFIGVPGQRVDGGTFATDAAAAGAAGALVSRSAFASIKDSQSLPPLIVCDDPVAALGELAKSARAQLTCPVIGITGSTGKTSTKDILGAILGAQGKTFTTAGNRNTEIGMPLELLKVDNDTTAVVLEMAMRAEGEIAELVSIAEPDAGLIVNIGPVHLETLGSIERVAAAKSELITGLAAGKVGVTPAGDALLEPYLRDDLDSITFGPTGDCRLLAAEGRHLTIEFRGEQRSIEVDFDQPHNRLNLLAAAGVALGLGFSLPDRLSVEFSGLRGERKAFEKGVVVIDDCYNANPMSMRAALADLAGESERRGGRKVAVLGDMLELGSDSPALHRQLGADASSADVDLLITVGSHAALAVSEFAGESVVAADANQAAEILHDKLETGDTVLVKASRGVGLEVVAQSLAGQEG
mgnify:CR=1 FL=1